MKTFQELKGQSELNKNIVVTIIRGHYYSASTLQGNNYNLNSAIEELYLERHV